MLGEVQYYQALLKHKCKALAFYRVNPISTQGGVLRARTTLNCKFCLENMLLKYLTFNITYNPIFYCRICHCYINKDVCKKSDLKILKFDRLADIFITEANFFQIKIKILNFVFSAIFFLIFNFWGSFWVFICFL